MIHLLGLQPAYMPGEELEFEYRFTEVDLTSITAIEASVVWHTEGKGSEDLGVHFFERLTGDSILNRDWSHPYIIRSRLPSSPLSYEGRLVKIRWCVRIRVYLRDGNELVDQKPFYLGTITREI